ncbi:PTS galactitol transporter subunit IIC [Lactobacillus terrae]|uniref:PTS galactitol transporter subunit IIC n=1 Tax=Lactobacillus terrae TaxID=2269374 RepID=UPI000C1B6D89|nr:PTS transporter subunit IIC [Lactobacillus terrae]
MVVINYIMSLGANVMMPIVFIILGLCLGLGVAKSIKSGIMVGVGFVGLTIVTELLAENLGPAVNKMVQIYGLNLKVLDIGWPAAATVSYGTKLGAIVIPVGLVINMIMLFTKTTNTMNINLWSYWHYAFVGTLVTIATNSFWLGFFALVVTIVFTLVGCDLSQKKMEEFYGEEYKGVSFPQAFSVGFIPFAIAVNWIIERIPVINKIDIDAEKMQKRYGLFGDPAFLGVIIGILLGLIAHYTVAKMLTLGITMAAVMVLIPRITKVFMEGLNPTSQRAQYLLVNKYKTNRDISIGITPSVIIGHPVTLAVGLLLVPITLFLSVILPGNMFLPLASLAGLIYVFPLVLPYTKGNAFRTLITGIVGIMCSLWFATALAPTFTKAVHTVSPKLIPHGTNGVASLDFAGSLIAWVTYELSVNATIIGVIVLGIATLALMLYNRRKIVAQK